MSQIQPGLTGTASTVVTPELTATHLGSGDVDVYATPAMIALMEAAAVSAIDHLLPEGRASVGVSIQVEHLAATPLGQQVQAKAEIIAVEGRRITFTVQAHDEQELIGKGVHTRFVIDTARFVERIQAKAAGKDAQPE